MGVRIFLILMVHLFFLSCHIYQARSIQKDYFIQKSVQYVTSNGKTDTLYKVDTIYKNAKIFVKGHFYNYTAIYYDSTGTLKTTSKIKVIGTNTPFIYAPTQTSVTYVFKNYKKDSLQFLNYFLNENLHFWGHKVTEGVIEHQERVWMHPFRHNQFIWTEIMGYPEIILPIKNNMQWENTLTIPMGAWGDWAGKMIQNIYQVKGQELFYIKKDKIMCWKIVCKSIMDKKEGYVTFLFNEELGFVKMDYVYYSGDKISFKMIDYKK